MILSDGEIIDAKARGDIAIEPFTLRQLQPASYELLLGPEFLDPDTGDSFHLPLMLQPGQFGLCSSREWLTFGPQMVGQINGKSSLGRQGIMVHVTAGFFDPGFHGQATLEVLNVSQTQFRLDENMPIAQMLFMRMAVASLRPYGTAGLGSRYVGQHGPTPVRPLGLIDPERSTRGR